MSKQSRHFSFIFAPYGAGCQSLWLNLMRSWVSTSTTSTKRGTTSPLRAGPSAASNGFCRGASRTFKPPSCSFGTGTGSTAHRGPPLFPGWRLRPWRQQLLRLGGLIWPS